MSAISKNENRDNSQHGLQHWRYKHGSAWRELPDWCGALFQLGARLGATTAEEKYTVVLTLPTVDYAAVFIALGAQFVLSGSDRTDDPEDHFLTLCDLPEGSVVTYLSGGKLKNGLFGGVEVAGGNECLVVRYGTTKRDLVPVKLSHLVQPSHREDLKLHKNQKGRDPVENAPFLRAALGDGDAEAYTRTSATHTLLIGNRKRLRYESDEELGIYHDGDFHCGNLKTLLRPSGTRSSYRCVIHSDRGGFKQQGQPPLVITETAAAYLRFGAQYRDSHRVILLDRCEARFEDAVNEFNRAYVDEHDRAVDDLGRLPLACEASCYVTVSR